MSKTKPTTKRRCRRSPKRGGCSRATHCSAAFTPATRAELMLLSCGVEECERALFNVASQLRHITAALAEIIHKTKPNADLSDRAGDGGRA